MKQDVPKQSGLSAPPYSVSVTENALAVLKSRYLKRSNDSATVETPSDLYWRVARSVASADQLYGYDEKEIEQEARQFFDLMAKGIFMPNSPTLMNAGRSEGMLSACTVLPVEDSIDGIFASIGHAAAVQKSGSGTGFDFSRLRPNGDSVGSTGGTTSGPISFMHVFSAATNAIQQGALRRGANMGVLRVDHPDIIEFIKAKDQPGALTNFNLSIAVTDKFMERLAVSPNSAHIVCSPRGGIAMPLRRSRHRNWKVREVFDLIVQRAWRSGEPGLLFLDHINAGNPTPHMGAIEATNPCGEQPLLPYESCNLGGINLLLFVSDGPQGAEFDFTRFSEVIPAAVRFLDNVIDLNTYPVPECKAAAEGNRKIGLGVMGFADCLFKLRVPYDSDEALALAGQIMKTLQDRSHDASQMLAKEKGCFPNWKGSIWEKRGIPMRNACTTTVAPTGSVSIIAGCSAGIEPLYSVVFQRRVLNDQTLMEVNGTFESVARERGFHSDELMEEIYRRGSLRDLSEIPRDIQRVFVTAHDIEPAWHVKMQAAFQEYCDASISKTINLPHQASAEDVRAAFLLAFDLGCKGITVYRDGCRSGQPMATIGPEGNDTASADADIVARPMSLPDTMPAMRIRQATPFGNMHIKVVMDAQTGREREVFAQLGKGGDLANSDLEAICRLLSLYLRIHGSFEDAIGQLKGIGSSFSIPTKDGRIASLADGLARGMEKYLEAKEVPALRVAVLGSQGGNSPEGPTIGKRAAPANATPSGVRGFRIKCTCGADLVFAEGCVSCSSCGYAEC